MASILNGVGPRPTVISDNPRGFVETTFMPLFRLVAVFRTWRKRVTERNYLLNSDHRLRIDLLATRQDIESEVSKPFWRS